MVPVAERYRDSFDIIHFREEAGVDDAAGPIRRRYVAGFKARRELVRRDLGHLERSKDILLENLGPGLVLVDLGFDRSPAVAVDLLGSDLENEEDREKGACENAPLAAGKAIVSLHAIQH